MKIGSKNLKYVYVAYSHDKYLLPLAVCDSVTELAAFLDRPAGSVYSAIAQGSPYVARIYVGD